MAQKKEEYEVMGSLKVQEDEPGSFDLTWDLPIKMYMSENVASNVFYGGIKNKHLWRYELELDLKSSKDNQHKVFLVFLQYGNPNNYRGTITVQLGARGFIDDDEIMSLWRETKLDLGERRFCLGEFTLDRKYVQHASEALEFQLVCHVSIKEGDEEVVDFFQERQRFTSMEKTLMHMKDNKEFTDFTITSADEKTFRVHKCVVAEKSKVFRGMFLSNMKESIENAVKISNYDGDVIEAMIEYMYSGKICDSVNLRQLAMIANQYDVDDLMTGCAALFKKQLNDSNFLETLQVAYAIKSAQLKSSCAIHLKKNSTRLLGVESVSTFFEGEPKILMELLCLQTD